MKRDDNMGRGFEFISSIKNYENINLPTRSTYSSAGYDFYAINDFILPSIWKLNFIKIFNFLFNKTNINNEDYIKADNILKPYLIPTGIKSYMNDNEFLMLVNRSSSSLKRHIIIPNGVGIIDADYYNNPSNEGEIFFQLINFGVKDQLIKKGERIGQGIFLPFLRIDNDNPIMKNRNGGFGSSGK